jgi:hypothetical protein
LPELEEGFLDAAGGGGCDALVDGKGLLQVRGALAGVAVVEMAVSEGINARNTGELHRQLTRQAMATLLRRGIRATVSSGIPLHPAASTVIRVAGQFLGEELPALPAHSATS